MFSQTFACNWPIGSGDTFKGVYHRLNKRLYLFKKVASGSKEATVTDLALEDPQARQLLGEELHTALVDDLALLDELDGGLDVDAVWEQRLTPVFFGSAQNNFGVQVFLDTFLDISATPRRMRLADDGPGSGKGGGGAAAVAASGGVVTPTDAQFSGFVFKLQANMDPRHRDKVAFLRVVSGEFRRGMKVLHPRTGRTVALTRPQKMFGQERETTEVAYAGDILGLNNPGLFAVGDTVCTGPARAFPQIPSFSPELFATLRNTNTGKYKQFNKGVAELLSEGAVEAMTSLDAFQAGTPILAAVGQLQFEVVQERMRTEYGCETVLDPLPYTVARWVLGGWPALEKAGRIFNASTVKDCWGRPVLLFRNQWNVDTLLSEQPEIGDLSPIGLPPTAAELAQAAARDR
jgi:peptide chain release factor 3